MVAGLLCRAGVWMGDDLLEAGEGNAFGHFEDKQILEFHRQLLASRRESRPIDFDHGTLRSVPLQFKPLKREVRRADALLKKLERPGLWGWKDPRTSLFLKFWLARLENAFVVVPFRHPLDVYASHLRRANNLDMACLPALIFQSYLVYNRAILDAASAFPGRFLFVEASLVAEQPGLFLEKVSSFIGAGLNKGPEVVGFVQRKALAGGTVSKHRHTMLQAVFPEVADIYEALVAAAGPRITRPLVAGEEDARSRAQTQLLVKAAEMLPSDAHECLTPLLERWALGMSGESTRAKRELIYSRIQLEISERERIIGEMHSYVAQLEASLKASEEREAACAAQLEHQREYAEVLDARAGILWRERDEALERVQGQHTQLERQRAYAKTLDERNGSLWRERDAALKQVQDQHAQIEGQIEYAKELESCLRSKETELKALTEREAASQQELEGQRAYTKTLDERAGSLWRERDVALQRVQEQHAQIEGQIEYAKELESCLLRKETELKDLCEREGASQQELEHQREYNKTLEGRVSALWRERDAGLERAQDQQAQIERQILYAKELEACLRAKDVELQTFSAHEEIHREVEEQKLFRFVVRTGLIKDAGRIARSRE